MKKVLLVLICICLLLPGCSGTDASTETVAADYRKVTQIAEEELRLVFSEFDDLEITETSAMVRTNDESHIIIRFKYESSNGSGVYGFEYQKDDYGNYELLQQGEDVTMDNLVE